MKEFLIAMALLAAMFGGAWAMIVATAPTAEEKVARDNRIFAGNVKHVVYNEHQYLWIDSKYGGVVHDPDCKCFLKGEAK